MKQFAQKITSENLSPPPLAGEDFVVSSVERLRWGVIHFCSPPPIPSSIKREGGL
jgi:hypothetical protein